MNYVAPLSDVEVGASRIGLEDIPAIAVLLGQSGRAIANQAFFDVGIVTDEGVVSGDVSGDLARQLVAVRDGESQSATLTVDPERQIKLDVSSYKVLDDGKTTLFLLACRNADPHLKATALRDGDFDNTFNDSPGSGTAEEILNTLLIPVFVHDDGRLLYGNPALARLCGYRDVDTLLKSGVNRFDFLAQMDPLREAECGQNKGSHGPSSYQTELTTRDGHSRAVEINANVMNWYGRDVVIGSILDVTDAREAVAKLEKSEARFRDYTSTAANWFWESDDNDRFVHLSDGVEDITGIPNEKVLGRTRTELFEQCDGEYVDDPDTIIDAINNRIAFRDFKYSIAAPSGKRMVFSISGVPIFDESGNFSGYRGTSRDITEERELQEAISYAASHDDLTGLLNRRELVARVDSAIENAGRRREAGVEDAYDFLCLIDLDGLKIINDTVGHGFGDELLVQCSTLLKKGVRDGDLVSRLGGDEFGILLRRISREEAVNTIERLLKRFTHYKFHRESHTFNVSFSAGLICIDGTVTSTEDLFAYADLSCYTAKERGKGQVCVYETSDDVVARHRVEMHTASRIESAIENDLLVVHAQPIVSLKSDVYAPDRYELLVRMLNPDGSLLPPGAFIGAAERYNLAPRIDRFVMHHAFDQISPFLANGDMRIPGITLNLSGETLGDPGFGEFVIDLFKTFDSIKPSLVCFELTETAAIRNLDVATAFIHRMRELGCSFALDDFGTGLSSFSYLKDLHVDLLKIDGIFIDGIVNDQINRAVVTSICEVARSLGQKVVAEGVEDKLTVNMLTALGVDYGQGYVWARPKPLVDILNGPAMFTQTPVRIPPKD